VAGINLILLGLTGSERCFVFQIKMIVLQSKFLLQSFLFTSLRSIDQLLLPLLGLRLRTRFTFIIPRPFFLSLFATGFFSHDIFLLSTGFLDLLRLGNYTAVEQSSQMRPPVVGEECQPQTRRWQLTHSYLPSATSSFLVWPSSSSGRFAISSQSGQFMFSPFQVARLFFE
jgi:hypothetical protein